jgi:hypothetical protein
VRAKFLPCLLFVLRYRSSLEPFLAAWLRWPGLLIFPLDAKAVILELLLEQARKAVVDLDTIPAGLEGGLLHEAATLPAETDEQAAVAREVLFLAPLLLGRLWCVLRRWYADLPS